MDAVSYNKCSDTHILRKREKYLVQRAFFSFWSNLWSASLSQVEELLGNTQSHLTAQRNTSSYDEYNHQPGAKK